MTTFAYHSTFIYSMLAVYLEVDHGVVVVPEDKLRLAHVVPELTGEGDGVTGLDMLLTAAQDTCLHNTQYSVCFFLRFRARQGYFEHR